MASDSATNEQIQQSPKQTSISGYDRIILEVFRRHYKEGATRVIFAKDELQEVCDAFGITVRNIPDIIYTYRSRRA